MNRAALGLAVGAGYVLGRTKKMKLAFAVGTMVAGKRMKLSPRALAEMVSTQLENNPQFKEIGDQLRQDLRGVGKAATGALVERQIEGLAGRLHSRTQGVRDQISGVAPDVPDVDDVRGAGEKVTGVVSRRGRGRDEEPYDEDGGDAGAEADTDDRYEDEDDSERHADEVGDEAEVEVEDEDEDEKPRRRASESSGRRTRSAEKNPSGRGSGEERKAPAKRPAAKTAAARRSGGGRTSATKKTAAKVPAAKKTAGTATRTAKGGGGRG
ncbi:DNA primase [Streptomyces sp. NPDC050095]|uniref:DNA primase n=1 Tax=unclassified Streptomyces TaxID=2593676 RepID=UPI0034353FC2